VADPWVVNASPLIVLAKVGHVGVLDELARSWVVPEAVVQEIAAGPVDDPGRKLIEQLPGEQRCSATVPAAIIAWDLDPGESEVLAWVHEHREYLAIVDDRAARQCAAVFGIKVIGTIGVLVRAKKAGLIAELKPVLAALRAAGLHMSSTLEAEALKLAAE